MEAVTNEKAPVGSFTDWEIINLVWLFITWGNATLFVLSVTLKLILDSTGVPVAKPKPGS